MDHSFGAATMMRRFCRTGWTEFNAKTQPLAVFYEKIGALRRIDGNRDRDAVFADISRLIEQSAA